MTPIAADVTAPWAIMPFVGNPEMTIAAAQDVLAQTLTPTLLLIDNGTPGRKDFDPVQAWALTDGVRDRVFTWSYPAGFPSLAGIWNRALAFVWAAGADRAWVVNNDVRLHPRTLEVLSGVLDVEAAWFVTANNVGPAGWNLFLQQYANAGADPDDFLRQLVGDPVRHAGPDFSCFVISRECHRWFQFDERFEPAYHEDNDYHRRLELAGLGAQIFGVGFPYLHLGSGTVNAMTPEARAKFHDKFVVCRDYYVEKWGGLPHHETYALPFNRAGFDPMDAPIHKLLLGQGRPGHLYPWGPADVVPPWL